MILPKRFLPFVLLACLHIQDAFCDDETTTPTSEENDEEEESDDYEDSSSSAPPILRMDAIEKVMKAVVEDVKPHLEKPSNKTSNNDYHRPTKDAMETISILENL